MTNTVCVIQAMTVMFHNQSSFFPQ